MAFHGYQEVDHTADIALRVWGEDFQVLLRQAAGGMYCLMGVEPVLGLSEETSFTITQANCEILLVDFLSELLYMAEEANLVLDDFVFEEGQHQVRIRSTGRKIQFQERAIKAVTFHDLTVKETSKGLIATITFDV